MAELHPAARELLESDALVHLVTINPDGSPQVSIVWVGLDGDEIVTGHLPLHRKLRNVQRDPRVSLSIEGQGLNPIGLRSTSWSTVARGSRRAARRSSCSAWPTSTSGPT